MNSFCQFHILEFYLSVSTPQRYEDYGGKIVNENPFETAPRPSPLSTMKAALPAIEVEANLSSERENSRICHVRTGWPCDSRVASAG